MTLIDLIASYLRDKGVSDPEESARTILDIVRRSDQQREEDNARQDAFYQTYQEGEGE